MQDNRVLVAAFLMLAAALVFLGCSEQPLSPTGQPRTNQAMLADVAKNGRHADARLAAAKQLGESYYDVAQATFAELAMQGHSNICQEAVGHITDPVRLADVAKHSLYSDVRQTAVSRLANLPANETPEK